MCPAGLTLASLPRHFGTVAWVPCAWLAIPMLVRAVPIALGLAASQAGLSVFAQGHPVGELFLVVRLHQFLARPPLSLLFRATGPYRVPHRDCG